MRAAIALLFVMLLGAAGWAEEAPAIQSIADWETGTYWTYETTRVFSPTSGGWSDVRGSLTFIVLGGSVCQGIEIWTLAAISEAHDGSEVIDVAMHIGPRVLYQRWPIVVDFLPRAETSASETGLTRTAAAFPLTVPVPGLPMRVSRALPVTVHPPSFDEPLPDWLVDAHETGSTWETVTLTEEERAEVTASAGTFSNAIPIQYQWERFGERHSGTAWWVPQVGWWARADGQEETEDRITLSYTITLVSWGVLSPEEMESRLASALQSTQRIDPPAAQRVQTLLEELESSGK